MNAHLVFWVRQLTIAAVVIAGIASSTARCQTFAADPKADSTKADDSTTDSAATDANAADPAAESDEPKVIEPPKLPDPENAKRLSKDDHVWVDAKGRQVFVDGAISLREGYLEMFACTAGTKEHESIVSVNAHAATVHAALLAAGAVPGHPVSFSPVFKPATGDVIDVEVHWMDPQQKWQHVRAQQWIRDVHTKKPMTQSWVFAGSGFWVDEKTNKKYYMAEAGDFICVSNFATAMMDVPIESSHENDALSFEANPKGGIPPLGMPVRLVLKPQPKPKAAK